MLQEEMRVSAMMAAMGSEARGIMEKLPSAQYRPLTSDGASWIILCRQWRPSTPEAFAKLWKFEKPTTKVKLKVYGRECEQNRYSVSWGASYRYSGQTSEAVAIPDDSFVAELMREFSGLATVNMCLQNWYEPQHHIGAHADDEHDLVPDSPIMSLSWGATRRFLFKAFDPPRCPSSPTKKLEILLHDGDLLIQGGTTQTTHKHEIPRRRKTLDNFDEGRRISWTFRNFKLQE